MVCDPVGAKIGNGGATMHALEQLQEQVPKEQLLKGNVRTWHTLCRGGGGDGCLCVDFHAAKVLMVHAGGYSQRLPSVSVIGKVFLALPSGKSDVCTYVCMFMNWMLFRWPKVPCPHVGCYSDHLY